MKHISKLIIMIALLLSSNAWGSIAPTPLMTAASNGNLAEARRLINNGADVNEQDANGTTALMDAVYGGNIHIVKALLKAGAKASINLQNNQHGNTALIKAVDYRRRSIARELLKAGADTHIRNNQGYTAVHMALFYGDPITLKIARDISVSQSRILIISTNIKQLSHNLVKFSWETNKGNVISFQIQQRMSSSDPWTTRYVSGNVNMMYFMNLAPNKTHYFRIKARDDDGWGEYKDIALVVTRSR